MRECYCTALDASVRRLMTDRMMSSESYSFLVASESCEGCEGFGSGVEVVECVKVSFGCGILPISPERSEGQQIRLIQNIKSSG